MAPARGGSEEQGMAVAKKPYSTPKLKRLGSVRELTLNGGISAPEGGMTMMTPQM
jgi:hypothetical protein